MFLLMRPGTRLQESLLIHCLPCDRRLWSFMCTSDHALCTHLVRKRFRSLAWISFLIKTVSQGFWRSTLIHPSQQLSRGLWQRTVHFLLLAPLPRRVEIHGTLTLLRPYTPPSAFLHPAVSAAFNLHPTPALLLHHLPHPRVQQAAAVVLAWAAAMPAAAQVAVRQDDRGAPGEKLAPGLVV